MSNQPTNDAGSVAPGVINPVGSPAIGTPPPEGAQPNNQPGIGGTTDLDTTSPKPIGLPPPQGLSALNQPLPPPQSMDTPHYLIASS